MNCKEKEKIRCVRNRREEKTEKTDEEMGK